MAAHFTFVTPPDRCDYLPDRTRQIHYELTGTLTPDEYMVRLAHGWRRFGHAMFRPLCPSCQMCQSVRVPADTFRASRTQRRIWNANRPSITIEVDGPAISSDKRALYMTFHDHQHVTKGWPAPSAEDFDAFLDNPFPTEEWCYRIDGRLVGVGYVDVLPRGMSAIYFFHDPAERHRSLGTFNVLSLIAATRERGLPHLYLGYYVEGCRSLAYKERFRPNEVLRPDGLWQPFVR